MFIGGPLLVNVIPAPGVGEKDRPLVAKERREAFAWMTTLGYPEIKDLKFVLVATGDWLQHGSKAPENRIQYGFLLEEKRNSFRVLSLDLEVQKFEKTPPNTPAHQQVDFGVLDLGKEAAVLLENLGEAANKEKKPGKRMGIIFGPNLSERTEVFLLAWACSRRGLDEMGASPLKSASNLRRSGESDDCRI
jgi:hypothetical protein